MGFQVVWDVGVFFQIVLVCIVVVEEYIYNCIGECSICFWFQDQIDIGLFYGFGVIDIDDDDFGVLSFVSCNGVGYYVDLCGNCVGVLDYDLI